MQYIVATGFAFFVCPPVPKVGNNNNGYFIFNSWTPSATTKLTNVFEFSKHHAYHVHIEISILHQPCYLAACMAVATFHGCNLYLASFMRIASIYPLQGAHNLVKVAYKLWLQTFMHA